MNYVDVAAVAELEDGQMGAVDVAGKRVLVAMVAGRYFAVGAVCTHERANLDQGTLIGTTVYCPLHYSAFDLATGECVGPPAERSTPVYDVKTEGNRILVSVQPLAPAAARTADLATAPLGEAALSPSDSLDHPKAAEIGPPSTEIELRRFRQSRPWHLLLMEAVAHQRWLASLNDALTRVATPVRAGLARTGLLELAHGSRWLGHPVHPMLSDVPIGLWFAALALYAISMDRGGAILTGLGLVAALATALTGAADWSVTEGPERRVALFHGLLMTIAFLIEIGSLAAFLFVSHSAALVLSAVGLTSTLGGAYFGGHLVFSRGTQVDHTAWIVGPRQWTRAIAADSLPEGKLMAVEVEHRQVLLFSRSGVLSAIEETCSHAGGPLSRGRLEDDCVVCPWHGSRFRLTDGSVRRGPATQPQPILEVRIQSGWIEVRQKKR